MLTLRHHRIPPGKGRSPLAAFVLAGAASLTSHSCRTSRLEHRGPEVLHVVPNDEAGLATGGWLEGLFGNIYLSAFWPLLAVTCVLAWQTRPTSDAKQFPRGFSQYQLRYLLVWFLAITADWLQGPYVYELYATYGYSKPDIARLFVAGFGSSMLTGTFIGSVADAWGRKFCAILYCVLYAAACVTKHVNSYSVLMIGRLLGGAATSLLFSTFECWMVGEHRRCGFSDDLLRYMFGLMFFVQYLAAIGAGLLAQFAASALPLTQASESVWYGGAVTPFDVSFVFLILAMPAIWFLWQENYGEMSEEAGGDEGFAQIAASFQAGCRAMSSSWQVPLLGLAVAAFESSMYAFVFNWTPALDSGSVATPPHGLIFSAFMMACMCGSSLFSLSDNSVQPIKVLMPICLGAAISLGVVAASLYTTYSEIMIFAGFLAFEACVGAYFPCVSTVKSAVVPEEARAGVYNVYRVPLNLCVVLLLLADLELKDSFALCSTLLIFSVIAVAFIAKGSSR
mmetsp:Transcript_36444/g.84086  ORF Transcript_36444/g.84086 Transcript_36444/m.84086 type:complete len:509 (+) Transcript_36444:63-1589(+)